MKPWNRCSLLNGQKRDLRPALNLVERAIRDFEGTRDRVAVYQAELRHLNDNLRYKVAIGDAAIPFAAVNLIPLPIVGLEIVPQLPAYAQATTNQVPSFGSQVVVLEGSAVKAQVTCVNKPLRSVEMTILHGEIAEQIEFAANDDARRTWSPPTDRLLAKNVVHELRYELQVIDADGLSLETPIRGTCRVQSDKRPTTTAKVVHRLVLPTAIPVVGYQVDDDFGISRVTLAAEVERGGEKVSDSASNIKGIFFN